MGTGSFPGVKCGQGVLLTTHPLLVPRSRKSRAIPLPTLWATQACNRDYFTFLHETHVFRQSAPDSAVQFKPNLNILNRFSLRSPIPDFKEIRPVGAALIHADIQTWRTRPERRSYRSSVGDPVLLDYDASRASVSRRFYARQLLRLQKFKGPKRSESSMDTLVKFLSFSWVSTIRGEEIISRTLWKIEINTKNLPKT